MKFQLFKIIDIRIFLIALFIGLIYIYIDTSKKDITVFPTPSNINNILYRDKAENCYSYEILETKCPENKSNIKNISIE